MIADKVFSCVNLITLNGDVVSQITPYKNITQITAVSKRFDSDIEAINSVKDLISKVCKADFDNARVNESYNPTFYPTCSSITQLEHNKITEECEERVDDNNQLFMMSNTFDSMGDHVIYRAECNNDSMNMIVKVVTDPVAFLQEKQLELLDSLQPLNTSSREVRIH